MAEETTAEVFTLSTVLLVEELWSGDTQAAPVADAALVSCGDEAEVLIEQEVFLAEYLAQAVPGVIARFPMPEGTALRVISMIIPREELPKRIAVRVPIDIPCLVIPSGADLWVVVLPLRYTLHVDPEDDLVEAVKGEVLRMVAAEELSPQRYLSLFPSRTQRLERVSLEIARNERLPAGRAAAVRKALAERHKRKAAAEVLESVSTPWHTQAPGEAPPIEGREAELSLLSSLLGGDERGSVALVGPEAAGKTELLRAWFHREAARKRERLVYQTSGAQLIAGMSGLGQWQERIRRVFEAAEALDAVLYFDNLGDLFAERVEGNVDLAGAMKPYLEQGRVRLVGELSPELIELAESRQAGFMACLSRVKVEPLSAAATARALRARVAYDRKGHPEQPWLSERAIDPLVDLAERYLPYRAFPGKAFRLLDELRSAHSSALAGVQGAALTVEQLFDHFSLSTGVPAFLLRDDRGLKAEDVARFLRGHLVGQSEAVRRVADTVCVVKAGLQPSGKPLSTFLFVGPTGVGKTELARALAAYLFGSPDRMLRFDMSEYMDSEAAERLIRGTDRSDGLLTRRVREQPFCVLLLDEIEKASRGVFDLLLQVCGEGRLTDARGKVAYFHNTILIMTSNLGAAHHRPSAGFGGASEGDDAYYARQVASSFRPEFVNRIDRVIAFHPLTAREAERVAQMTLEKVCSRRGLLDAGVTLGVSREVLSIVARAGYSERYGARALRRHVEDRLVAPVARLLSSLGGAGREVLVRVLAPGEPEADGNDRAAGLEERGLRFEVIRRQGAKEQGQAQGTRRVSELRRQVAQLLKLSRVEQVREQIDYLVAQINYGNRKAKDRRLSAELSELQAELHRLSEGYQALVSSLQQLEATEELALVALFDGAPLHDLLSEAEAEGRKARAAAVRVLLALEERRDGATFKVIETGAGGLLWWHSAFSSLALLKGWECSVHIQDDPFPSPGVGFWPKASRRWGPPRGLDEVGHLLRDKESGKVRGLLVRSRGPLAGVLAALEAGSHRFLASGDEKPCVAVRMVAMRAVIGEDEWKRPEVLPPPPAAVDEAKRAKPVRDFDVNTGKLITPHGVFACDAHRYGEAFDTMIIEQLLSFEREDRDRDGLFSAPLDEKKDEAQP